MILSITLKHRKREGGGTKIMFRHLIIVLLILVTDIFYFVVVEMNIVENVTKLSVPSNTFLL